MNAKSPPCLLAKSASGVCEMGEHTVAQANANASLSLVSSLCTFTHIIIMVLSLVSLLGSLVSGVREHTVSQADAEADAPRGGEFEREVSE